MKPDAEQALLFRCLRTYPGKTVLSAPFSEHLGFGGLRKGYGGVKRITEVEYMGSAAAIGV